MSKKTILVSLGFAFLFSFNLARAGVIINEVQLSPTEERFIELYNPGGSSVELTGWYIQRKTETGSAFGSLVSKTYFENKAINADDYFLISHDSIPNADIVLGSLTLTESNMIQLKNSNQEIVDKIGWGEASDCEGACAPNPATGKSIQKMDDDWIVSASTPGEENQVSGDEEENNNDDESNNESEETTAETKKAETPLANKTKITAQMPAFAGLPVQFKISNTVSGKSCGKYSLNFGDGNSLETQKIFSIPEKFTHIYYYPGEYIVTVECYKSYLSSEPDASDKMTIKVVLSEVVISKTGDVKDFFVEISNNAPYEADISSWVLSSYQNKFIFPKNTILKSKNKIIISPKTTNFSILDKDTLSLVNSEGETMSDFLSSQKQTGVSTKNSIVNSTAVKPPLGGFTANPENEQVPVDNLGATAVKSDSDTENNMMYGIGLFAFLGLSAGATYFIRVRNRGTSQEKAGDDFEIIDE